MDYWPNLPESLLSISPFSRHVLVGLCESWSLDPHILAITRTQEYYNGTHGSRHSTQPYILWWKHLGFNFCALGSSPPDMIKGKWVGTDDFSVWFAPLISEYEVARGNDAFLRHHRHSHFSSLEMSIKCRLMRADTLNSLMRWIFLERMCWLSAGEN